MGDIPENTLPSGHSPRPPEPGASLGPFRLLAVLGEGGMGRVFEAADERLGRRVALKVMRPEVAQDERARKMFLREARTAAGITHDRVVTIYEADEVGGVPYIAMELLAGEPLNALLRRTKCPPLGTALTVAYQIAEGLHAAHTHQPSLIHRDVKPANVWLRAVPGRKGVHVRLLDFGLARATGGDSLSAGNLTAVVGTPLYMAPEQWDGRGVDQQTDVYSLGVVLYQMLTGELPFRGVSVQELMFQVCMPAVAPTPPADLDPTIPADLSAFVLRMLAKDKARRVGSAAEVMKALARFRKAAAGGPGADADPARTLAPAPAPPPAGRRRRWAVGLAAVGLIAAAVAAGLALNPANRRERSAAANPPAATAPTATAPAPPPEPPAPLPPPPVTAPPVRPTAPAAATPPADQPMPPAPAAAKVRPPALDCTGPDGATEAEVKQAQRRWADYLGVPVEAAIDLGGGVALPFVLVPPGAYWMGTSDRELGELARQFPKLTPGNYADETPQHRVRIRRPLYVGKTEVTRGQFARFAAAGKEGEPPPWPEYTDAHPAVNVSWFGAKAFAGWAGRRPRPAGFGPPRLPTEAEWEYACRAGCRARYPNGLTDPLTLVTIANVCDRAAKTEYPKWDFVDADDGFVHTAPAGRFAPNRFGLHDMLGNVWEWCDDGYQADAYQGHPQDDPSVGPAGDSRVLRGGSWLNYPWIVRPGVRLRGGASDRDHFDGFRLVLPHGAE